MISQEPLSFFSQYFFADDTSVFTEGTHYQQVIRILNKEQKISTSVFKLINSRHLKKTHYMVFHRSRI